jgi:uncharacterized membrane protein YphA (DoxX/SURF4 family)
LRLHHLAVLGTRLFLGAIFFTSGMGKLTHGDFPGLIGPVWLEERLAQYGLAMWAQFVGWSQVTIGLLLLSQRFATLGALMLVPMLVNILIITISLQWRGTPYVNGFLLLLNLFLLAADRHRLLPLIADDDQLAAPVAHNKSPNGTRLAILGVVLGLLSPALYPLHRAITFTLAIAAVLLFFIASAHYYRPRGAAASMS